VKNANKSAVRSGREKLAPPVRGKPEPPVLSELTTPREATHDKLSGEHLFTNGNGDQMGNLELAGTVKMLQGQRAQVQKELAKLDKAIAVLRELSGTNSMPSQNGKRHTMSAAARRKIGKAQKARWAKVRQQRAAKG
jgi:hypothetical protein